MNMARTPKPSPAVLPSITQLGLILGGIAQREAAIDLMPLGRGEPVGEDDRCARAVEQLRRNTADRLLFDQLGALRSLIGTMPAMTLSDCVVQINVASHWLFRLTCNDLEPPEVRDVCDNLERIMISVLPVIAAAAGLDLVEFALDEVAILHEARFPELSL